MPADLAALQALAKLLPAIKAVEQKRNGVPEGQFAQYFQETGPFRRALYPKQMAFFAGGKDFYERLFMKANRVGGTQAGAYELTCHLTGRYPAWWEGHRFKGPVDCWIAGKNSLTTRDILQAALLGKWNALGSGMVPQHLIVGEPTRSRGIAEGYESFVVRHITGGISRGQFKSYEQGRQSFEGTAKHVIWLDEEGDTDHDGIYSECVTRTMTVEDAGTQVSGIIFMTFTPLKGLTPFIKEFMEKAVIAADDGTLMHAENIWQQTSDSNAV